MQNPVLLTGATGFLGSHARTNAPREWVGVGRRKVTGCVQLDLTNHAAVESFWEKTQPSGVLHLGACADVSACENDPDATRLVNIDASEHLAQLATARDIPFVYASTDLVFDGKRGLYSPGDVPNPINEYGRQKAEAERRVQLAKPRAVIARLPVMYDFAHAGTACFATELLEKWRRGEVTPLFEDEFRSPALARDVAEALWELLDHKGGVVHLAGPERMSRLAFAQLLANAFHFEPDLLKPTRQQELHLVPPRPVDVSLVSSSKTLRNARSGVMAQANARHAPPTRTGLR